MKAPVGLSSRQSGLRSKGRVFSAARTGIHEKGEMCIRDRGCTDCKDNAYWWEQRYPGWRFVRCVVPEPDAPGDEKEGWDADELRCYVVMVKREGAKVRTDVYKRQKDHRQCWDCSLDQ